MRDGHFGFYEVSNGKNIDIFPMVRKESPANQMGISNILINTSGHSQIHPSERTLNKDYQVLNILMFVPIPSIPDSKQSVAKCDSPVKLEASLGIHYGIRFGFNVTELLDLLIGFTTFDLLNDDEIEINSFKFRN
ncbi:hypothetical protein ND861_09585 [Leptospira sp. 2 VSF19]|nr:hypothetical protein [Leptospira soteropolitanensis]MCW7492543.1 hypothetical protein [Leptospira soteropolitanensis]MCW7526595.1 hypothetical protein [Leptospira soteropolitanensis]